MAFDNKELKRLQKLACIKLSPDEEKKLGSQLEKMVMFLDKLQEIKIDKQLMSGGGIMDNPLRVIEGVEKFEDAQALLQNVKHEKINNSIVIKSVLS